MISSTLPIETPEGISFSIEPASLADRGLAYIIDLLIRLSVVLVLGLLISFTFSTRNTLIGAFGLWMVLSFVVEWGYYVIFEVLWDGQCPGKRVFGLRVVKAEGHPIGFYDSALRNLLRAADIIPFTYAVGILSVLSTRRLQRLGDLAAGTLVIVEHRRGYDVHRRARAAATPVPPRPEVDAPIRALTLANLDRRLIEEFVNRMDLLHPERREQIASILAAPFRRKLRLLEAVDSISISSTELLVRLHQSTLQPRDPSRERQP